MLALALLSGACDIGTSGDPENLSTADASSMPSSPSVPELGGATQAGAANGGAADGGAAEAEADGHGPDGAPQSDSVSRGTAGFTGRVGGDGKVYLSWRADPGAEGYNVYRQGKYYTTVRATSYVDAKVTRGDYRYEIHSFTPGRNKRYKKVASGLTVRVGSAPSAAQAANGSASGAAAKGTSQGTAGFTGRVGGDGKVHLGWRADPGAEGYNVYRQGKYYTTVRATSYVDAKVTRGDYRYEIHSFTPGRNKRYKKVASGLTVRVGSAPSAAQAANGSASGAAAKGTSQGTAGFTGRVGGDGKVHLGWRADPGAEGYNVYRQGKYYTTVRATSYVDAKVTRGDYRYEIHSFTPGRNKRYKKVASGLTVRVGSVPSAAPALAAAAPSSVSSSASKLSVTSAGTGGGSSSAATRRDFASPLTAGFTGRLLDSGKVSLSWRKDPSAEGYNVFRKGKYVTTVRGEGYVDTPPHDGHHYYEIQSFTHGKNKKFKTVATALTIAVRGSGRIDPKAPKVRRNLLDDYQLVFADEFNNGALDTTKWNTRFLWGPNLTINAEQQYYVDIGNDPGFGFNPFTFENGKLVINSVRTPKHLKRKANNKPYLSGVITSYDAFKFTYGYVEARVRMPYSKGLWTAFWLLNAYYVDAKPEIDIVEYLGHLPNVAYHTYHYYDSNGRLRSTESKPTDGPDYAGDFHTFGVDWRPGLIVYYIDGAEVYRVSDAKVSRQDMYIIANTALGGWWPGSPDATTRFPARYEIDYIRAYRQISPYGPPPQSDSPSGIEPAEEVPGASPAHRPPPELWPEGYPEGL